MQRVLGPCGARSTRRNRPPSSPLRGRSLGLVAALVATAGCGGSSSAPTSATSTPCSCPGGTCDASGVCILPQGDGGTPGPAPLTCTASEKPLGTSSAPAVDVQRLGTVTVGQTAQFTVPAGTQSVTIVEQAVSAPDTLVLGGAQADNVAVPLRILDPGGNVLYDDTSQPSDPVAAANAPAFFASDSPATGTMTLPNTTGGLALAASGSLAAGTWRVVVSDYAYECATGQGIPRSACQGGSTASSYDLTILVKPAAGGGGISASGVLDLHVYFATASAPLDNGDEVPLSAATATATAGGDPDLTRMVQTLTSLLDHAGITLGTVTYTDLPSSVQAAYATGIDVDVLGACAPLPQLLKDAAPGDTLNAFFVSALRAASSSGGTQIVGVDGTIPGPATIGGTVASGVAVSAADLRAGRPRCGSAFDLDCGADETAYILAHEAGHHLGLYHVTEAAGVSFDPLLDTPTCACQACAPATLRRTCADATPAPPSGSEYQVSVADCTASSTCGGGDNLMFWILGTGSQGTLTTQQAEVMRANPLVH